MSSDVHKTKKNKFILIKDSLAQKENTGIKAVFKSKEKEDINVLAGSLWEESSHKSVDGTFMNLIFLEGDNTELSCLHRDVSFITEHECNLLLAVNTCNERMQILKDPHWLKEVASLKIGNFVHLMKQQNLPEKVVCAIRYIGPFPNYKGWHFGLEIMDPPSAKGKGNTDGTIKKNHYFHCPKDCGVFVPMNKIRAHNQKHVATKSAHYTARSSSSLPRRSPSLTDSQSLSQKSYSNAVTSDVVPKVHASHKLPVQSSSVRSRNPQSPQSPPSSKVPHDNNPHPKDHISQNAEGRSEHRSRKNPLSISQEDELDKCTLKVGDRIVWYSDDGPEHGVVKWLGFLPINEGEENSRTDFTAGIEFDRPVGSGTGKYNDQQLFKTKHNHASLIPVCGLVKENEFNTNPAESSPGTTASSTVDDNYLQQEELKMKEFERERREFEDVRKREDEQYEKYRSNRNRELQDRGQSSQHGRSTFRDKDRAEPMITQNIDTSRDTRVETGHSAHYGNSSDRALYSSQPVNPPASSPVNPPMPSAANPMNERREVENSFSDQNRFKSSREVGPPEEGKFDTEAYTYNGDLAVGSMVEVRGRLVVYGVIRWIGILPTSKSKQPIAGLEMEEESPTYTDGTFGNERYFTCPPNKGFFMYLDKCYKDSRFSDVAEDTSNPGVQTFGSIETPDVPGTVPPMCFNNLEEICGRKKGIQGHHNSCYLDASLFSMFAFTQVFDSILFRQKQSSDLPQYSQVQTVLKEGIINPLRKNFYVRADKVLKLRTLLDQLGTVQGMMGEEKDPEEFLNSLLQQIMKADPFITLSSGQNSFFYQLFVEKDNRIVLPTTQQLVGLSFLQTTNIKLAEVPSCFIIQMPRFGKDYKMYDRIVPSLKLDITDILQDAPRLCYVCGLEISEMECPDCSNQLNAEPSAYRSFCSECFQKFHTHRDRSKHRPLKLHIEEGFRECFEKQRRNLPNGDSPEIGREELELFAVVCIQTSHYVSFVRCGTGPDAPWVFFDSMADRVGAENGYNIPEVKPVPELPQWLEESNHNRIIGIKDNKQLPENIRRVLCDGYMCMYQSTEAMMYK
ncbi:unnamed protein product [Owenia fusiformis]|uniref:ubiquitinyl hydrolase 1 n=1 Tax=Owenia fusiformis TaxID=6347 RepID=A0A8J1UVI7_OWEFU|nr:unnamed protein product [Owenia fusiformis]